MSLNRFQLTINLTRELKLYHGTSGRAVAALQLASNRIWNDGNGHEQGRANSFRIRAFDKAAESHANFLHKGLRIYVEGRISEH